MKKSDVSIHNICLAAIKRSLMDTAELNYTYLYEKDNDGFPFEIEFNPNEIPICATIYNRDNWSLLTTQRLISKLNKNSCEADMETAINRFYGDFKDYKDKVFTFGKIENPQGEEIEYLIETGKSSMVMVQGVKTIIDIQQNSEEDNQKKIRRWNKRGCKKISEI